MMKYTLWDKRLIVTQVKLNSGTTEYLLCAITQLLNQGGLANYLGATALWGLTFCWRAMGMQRDIMEFYML